MEVKSIAVPQYIQGTKVGMSIKQVSAQAGMSRKDSISSFDRLDPRDYGSFSVGQQRIK